jgi:hypothetical protein
LNKTAPRNAMQRDGAWRFAFTALGPLGGPRALFLFVPQARS